MESIKLCKDVHVCVPNEFNKEQCIISYEFCLIHSFKWVNFERKSEVMTQSLFFLFNLCPVLKQVSADLNKLHLFRNFSTILTAFFERGCDHDVLNHCSNATSSSPTPRVAIDCFL